MHQKIIGIHVFVICVSKFQCVCHNGQITRLMYTASMYAIVIVCKVLVLVFLAEGRPQNKLMIAAREEDLCESPGT